VVRALDGAASADEVHPGFSFRISADAVCAARVHHYVEERIRSRDGCHTAVTGRPASDTPDDQAVEEWA
jgi:hypothetical protein